MKKCACIIVNYNNADDVERLVNQIKGYKTFEIIIIVDNCSTDDSVMQLSKIVTKGVCLVKTEKNGGYGAGNNYGIKLAHQCGCEIAVIANPDVEFSEECMEDILRTFSANPDCAVATARQLTGQGKYKGGDVWNVPSPLLYSISSLYLVSKLFCKPIKLDATKKYQRVECVAGSLLAVDIKKFHSVGGYDESMFLYCEETLLGLKMKQKGYPCYVLPNSEYRHHHATSTSKSIPSIVKRKKMMLDNRTYLIKKYMKAGIALQVIAKICFAISLIEESMKVIIRKIYK